VSFVQLNKQNKNKQKITGIRDNRARREGSLCEAGFRAKNASAPPTAELIQTFRRVQINSIALDNNK